MHLPGKLVVSTLCLIAVAAGTPAVLAQAIPKSLIRLCLRNVATGIACYIVGRGGELIVDGSLSAAWAKAKETVTGEVPEDTEAEAARQRQLRQLAKPQPTPGKPLSPFEHAVIEPIKPGELGTLSKRLPGSLANKIVTEGFVIYDAPKGMPKPAVGQLGGTKSLLYPEQSLSERLRPKSLTTEPPTPKYLGPESKHTLGLDAYRARNADRLLPPSSSLTASQFATLQEACQKRRERETGLSFLAIMGLPDFEDKLKLRMEQVVKPCMSPH